MLKKALMATAVTFAALSAQAQTVLLSENFDNVGTLAGSGWVQTNLSSPIGTTGWFQGNDGVFASQSGAATSYIGANYNNAADGGVIANWLISPTFSTAVAGTVSFYGKADILAPFFDKIAFGFSTGSSAPATFTLGSAVTLGGAWTQYTVNFAAQGAGSVGRFAIEYTGLNADADYIGIDTFAVTTVATAPVPEPSTWAMMGLGLAGLAALRRKASAKR